MHNINNITRSEAQVPPVSTVGQSVRDLACHLNGKDPNLREFLAVLFGPENVSEVWVTSFPEGPPSWYGWRICEQNELPKDHNQYFSVGLIVDGKSRGDGHVGSHHVIVADDIGTKVTAEGEQKLRRILGAPTWTVETSPGNFQWGWVLDAPILSGVRAGDVADTDRLKQLFAVRRYLVAEGLTDKAVQDKSRYMRLPWGLNTKEKYIGKGENGGFPIVKLREWNPGSRVNLQEVCERIWREGWRDAISNPDVLADVAPSQKHAEYNATMDDGLVRLAAEIGLNPRHGAPGRIDADCPNMAAHTPGKGEETGFAFLGDDRCECHHDACNGFKSPDFKRMIFDQYEAHAREHNEQSAMRSALDMPAAELLPPTAAGFLMIDRPAEELATEAEALASSRQQLAAQEGIANRDALSAFTLAPVAQIAPGAIPPRPWLYSTTAVGGFISLIVSPGGSGKSSLIMAEAVAMASGRELLPPENPVRPLKVWLHNGEDDAMELRRRLAATLSHHGVTAQDLNNNLFLSSGRDVPIQLARQGRDGPEAVPGVADWLIETMKSQRIDVLILDPLGSLHGLIENSNEAMNFLANILRGIAHATGAAIVLVHHTGKQAALDMDAAGVGASRGASAIPDAARVVRQISRMSPKEAAHFGINETDRRFYFRTLNGKASMSPMSDAHWFRLVNVPLHNGTQLYPRGDHVGVVERWQPPGMVAGTKLDLQRVQDAISQASEPPRANSQSPEWVGYLAASTLGFDIGTPGTKAADRTTEQATNFVRVRGMLSDWIRRGGLLVESVHDDAARKPKPVIRVGMPAAMLSEDAEATSPVDASDTEVDVEREAN